MGEAPRRDRGQPGKLATSMSVEVMCQRSCGPRRPPQPLHRHALARAAPRRDRTRSAWRSVFGSMPPPCGAMAISPRWRPSSRSRSTKSPSVSASCSEMAGFATTVIDGGGQRAAAAAEPPPPARPHADDAARVLLADLAHRVEGDLLVVAADSHLAAAGEPDRREPLRIRRAVLGVRLEVPLRGPLLPDRRVEGGHSGLSAAPARRARPSRRDRRRGLGPPTRRSGPGPPRRRSRPAPPARRSGPGPPASRSLPGPPSLRSAPAPPSARSRPAPGQIRSPPPRPATTSSPPSATITSRCGVLRSTSRRDVPTSVARAPRHRARAAAVRLRAGMTGSLPDLMAIGEDARPSRLARAYLTSG